jgi:hypothetical protein
MTPAEIVAALDRLGARIAVDGDRLRLVFPPGSPPPDELVRAARLPTLQPEVIAALRSAGATEEIIAGAVKASGELRTPHPGGRPRKHANEAERARRTASARSVTKLVP